MALRGWMSVKNDEMRIIGPHKTLEWKDVQ